MAETTDPVEETVDETPKRPRQKKTVEVPTPGRIVLYTDADRADPLPALVTVVPEDADKGTASLVIFREHTSLFRTGIPFSEEPKQGHWHWPVRS